MAEGARLESVYTATYPGFESPPHRHILRRARTKVRAFFRMLHASGGCKSPHCVMNAFRYTRSTFITYLAYFNIIPIDIFLFLIIIYNYIPRNIFFDNGIDSSRDKYINYQCHNTGHWM